MGVELWDAATGGALVFDESYTGPNALLVDDTGTISFWFGSQQIPPGLNPGDFPSGSSRYLDVTQGGGSVLAGRLPLTAAPFALSPGPQGPTGPQGATGSTGLTGATARWDRPGRREPPDGLTGATGAQGPTGPAGLGWLDPALVATLRWDQLPRGYGTFTVGTWPTAVAFDGTNIWVVNYGSHNVMKLRASDGLLQGTFAVGSFMPTGVAFDGANIWVANYGSATVSKLSTR